MLVVGEAKRKKSTHAAMLASEGRCVYCANPPSTVEHMPPISIFRERSRPRGLEFAACADCNHGTKSADIVAAFFARISIDDDEQLTDEAVRLRKLLSRHAPQAFDEFYRTGKVQQVWHGGRSGRVFRKMAQLTIEGGAIKSYLKVFSAKLGMALYREHVGVPLPMSGGVQLMFFSNTQLSDAQASGLVRVMPLGSTLKQGTFEVTRQFAYRSNSDEKSVVTALVGFHSNFHVLVVSTSIPEFFEMPFKKVDFWFVRPGELLGLLPQRASSKAAMG